MKTVIAAKNQFLVSLSDEELVALANCANEVLHNSNVDEHDCATRIGIAHEKLKSLHRALVTAVDSRKSPVTETFEAWRDGASIQIRAISVFGDAADLNFDEVRDKIQPLLDEEEKA
jgi:hypothetical protein